MHIPSPTYQREADFTTITSMITRLEHLAESSKTGPELLDTFQTKLDEYAAIYQYDEQSGSERSKLYELQAMLLQLKGKTAASDECLEQALSVMDPSQLFVSSAARSWLQARRAPAISEAEINLRKRLSGDGRAIRFMGWLALILTPLELRFISGNTWAATIIFTLVIALPLVLWFEYSGSYIEYLKGN